MTRPEIEPRSPGSLANTLNIMLMSTKSTDDNRADGDQVWPDEKEFKWVTYFDCSFHWYDFLSSRQPDAATLVYQSHSVNYYYPFSGRYLPMSPTRHGLTQGQRPEGRLK